MLSRLKHRGIHLAMVKLANIGYIGCVPKIFRFSFVTVVITEAYLQ